MGPGQSVWLFTSAAHSVRLHVQPGPAGFQLVIFGPGNATAEFDFAGMEHLERFREQYARDLIARGFELQAGAERRSGADRRAAQRPMSADRRK